MAVGAFSTFAAAQDATKTDTETTQKQEKREWRKGKRDGMGEGFRGGERGRMMREFQELNLTETQKEQIRTIMQANRPDQATMEEMRTLHQAKRDGTITAEQQERFKSLRQQSREKGEAVHQQISAIFNT